MYTVTATRGDVELDAEQYSYRVGAQGYARTLRAEHSEPGTVVTIDGPGGSFEYWERTAEGWSYRDVK
jgi:hypothetical protein